MVKFIQIVVKSPTKGWMQPLLICFWQNDLWSAQMPWHWWSPSASGCWPRPERDSRSGFTKAKHGKLRQHERNHQKTLEKSIRNQILRCYQQESCSHRAKKGWTADIFLISNSSLCVQASVSKQFSGLMSLAEAAIFFSIATYICYRS